MALSMNTNATSLNAGALPPFHPIAEGCWDTAGCTRRCVGRHDEPVQARLVAASWVVIEGEPA